MNNEIYDSQLLAQQEEQQRQAYPLWGSIPVHERLAMSPAEETEAMSVIHDFVATPSYTGRFKDGLEQF